MKNSKIRQLQTARETDVPDYELATKLSKGG